MAEEVVSISQKPANWITGFKDYVDDLRTEMRRVTWPSWKQVRATTAVVIAATFGFAAYFFVVDNIVSRVIQRLFDTFAPK